MNAQRKPDMQHLPPEVDRILLGGRIGIIANAIARNLDIDSVRALELFYDSETCEHLHDKSTGLYLFSDLYIAEEFLQELQMRQ
ncbi:MAG: hypothetical protein J6B92_00915 [Paraprevotella sp.]|nr:hypothetical protein [Paraprevotella sp.]